MPMPMNDADAQLVADLFSAASRFDARRDVAKAATCRDIAMKVTASGRFASLRQRQYAEALVRWSQPAARQAAAEAGTQLAANRSAERSAMMTGLSLQRIAQLFAAAALRGLERPVIRLRHEEWRITITPAPAYSRNAGSYYVKAKSGTEQRIYCGRIAGDDGRFFASAECPLAVQQALRDFSANPEEVARAYGRATGQCCFCGRELTDGRSVAMGYGPICAEHYGLPWGEERARSSVDVGDAVPVVNNEDLPPMSAIDAVEAQRRRAAALRPSDRALAAIAARGNSRQTYRRIPDPIHELRRNDREAERRRQAALDEDEDNHFM